MKLKSSSELIEVHLVDRTKYNLLSISQLCDAGFGVSFKAESCSIKQEKRSIFLIDECADNIYVLNNLDFATLSCFTVQTNDKWLWHRKLEYASMHAIKKFSRIELVKGLPKLRFEKDHLCDAYQLGK